MAISLTEKAARHVNRNLSKRGKGIGLRLGVRTTGCSGLAYELEYVDHALPDDQILNPKG
jgi:iron-sulfur cluster assembly protein